MIMNYYKEMLNNMFEGIYYVDTKKRISFWNKAAEVITGYSEKELLGSQCSQNILNHIDDEGNELCKDGCPLHDTLLDGSYREKDVFLHHKNGHRVPVKIKVLPIFDGEEISGAMEIFIEITNKTSEDFSSQGEPFKEFLDKITGFSNNIYAKSKLNMCHTDYITNNIPYSVVLIKIEDLDQIRIKYGEEDSNLLLHAISRSVFSSVRSNDFIARWKNDELMILYNGVDNSSLEKLIKKVHVLASNTAINRNNAELKTNVSIGAAIVHPTDTVDSLLARANELLEWSIENGGDRFTI